MYLYGELILAYKGKYKCSHPEKYLGDVDKIVYRSMWERDLMYHLDHNPNVIGWGSEEIVIQYMHPLDGKIHRYFPDFFVHMKTKSGKIVKTVIEVKPKRETAPPKPPANPKKPGRRYLKESAKYMVNEAKWNAAKEYCDSAGIVFRVMTEYDLYGPSGKKYRSGTSSKKKKN